MVDFVHANATLITVEDLNGDHFLGTQEGETLTNLGHHTFYFPHGVPSAANPHENVEMTSAQAGNFVCVNATQLMALHGIADRAVAVKIAFCRMLAVKHGLVSPAFVAANFFVKYQETTVLTEAQTLAVHGLGGFVTPVQAKAILLPDLVKSLTKLFTDRVCMVAFVFRARGHHYTQNYQELYERVWEKCRYKPAEAQLPWEMIAVHCFHAIYPVILDQFWANSVTNFRANGALCKRFDVAPAGAAGPFVINQGLRDLLMVAPGIEARLEEAIEYLDRLLVELREHRFNGSVNSVYYGARKVVIDEKALGAIAATIKAAVDNLTENAPIGASPALKRIANNAPITGAVLGRAIGNIANRPEVVDPLMIKKD